MVWCEIQRLFFVDSVSTQAPVGIIPFIKIVAGDAGCTWAFN
jgi:hypothetical protein